jgi:hypothetical protein
MNNKARLRLASLTLLGFAAAGCSGKSSSQVSNNPLTPSDMTMDPAAAVGSGGSSMDTPAESTEGVITPSGLINSVAKVENSGSACNVAVGTMAKNDDLPNPFVMHDGTTISAKTDWECRRNEIKTDIETLEIGKKPDPSETSVAATYDGSNVNVVVTSAAGSLTLTSPVTAQGTGDGPYCVGIGMDNPSSLITGCTLVTFKGSQVVGVNQNGMVSQSDPFYTVFPDRWQNIANYSAWSWGISRLIDGLDQVKDQLNIDMSKIAVHGCSYAGKMALFAGAFDERVALTIAQESGGGGINSWRLSQDFVTRTGTQIEKIDNTNYSWFMPSMKSLDPYSLPHDHHELIAMVAPRAFVTFGNRNYEWLGDESGYKSVVAAQTVWQALGAPEGTFGYDFTTDHTHCTAAPSQVDTATAFVNKFLHGQQDVDTNIAIPTDPMPHATDMAADGTTVPQATFDLDESKIVDWTAPTLN